MTVTRARNVVYSIRHLVSFAGFLGNEGGPVALY